MSRRPTLFRPIHPFCCSSTRPCRTCRFSRLARHFPRWCYLRNCQRTRNHLRISSNQVRFFYHIGTRLRKRLHQATLPCRSHATCRWAIVPHRRLRFCGNTCRNRLLCHWASLLRSSRRPHGSVCRSLQTYHWANCPRTLTRLGKLKLRSRSFSFPSRILHI